MLDTARLWRQFLNSSWLQAGAMGLLATVLAFSSEGRSPNHIHGSGLDCVRFLVDRSRTHPNQPIPAHRHTGSGERRRVRPGPWDRAIFARLLTSAHESGALAIGLDHRLDHASPAQLGGAASDALLLEAMSTAGPIVVVQTL